VENGSRHVLQKLYAHVETMRPYTLFWCGLVSLTGSVVAARTLPPSWPLVFFIPILGWIAGLYLADFSDRSLDRIQKPHRPIPSGRISPREALLVGGVFAAVGLALTVLLTWANILLTLLAAGLVFVYARWTKPLGLWGNLTRGMLTLVTFIFGVAAVLPFQHLSVSLWALAAVFFVHDMNSNIIGAMRDVSGDQAAGCRTTPVRYGMRPALAISLGLSLVYLGLAIILVVSASLLSFPTLFFLLLALGMILLGVMYGLLYRFVDQASPARMLGAHELFVAERVLFASAFVLGVLGLTGFTIALVTGSLVLTLVSQHLLRRRYELT